jgi:hypothetical protein
LVIVAMQSTVKLCGVGYGLFPNPAEFGASKAGVEVPTRKDDDLTALSPFETSGFAPLAV